MRETDDLISLFCLHLKKYENFSLILQKCFGTNSENIYPEHVDSNFWDLDPMDSTYRSLLITASDLLIDMKKRKPVSIVVSSISQSLFIRFDIFDFSSLTWMIIETLMNDVFHLLWQIND